MSSKKSNGLPALPVSSAILPFRESFLLLLDDDSQSDERHRTLEITETRFKERYRTEHTQTDIIRSECTVDPMTRC